MARLQRTLVLLAFSSAVCGSPLTIGATITSAPTSTAAATVPAVITAAQCTNISFPAIVTQLYTGLSTDPALQCQCLLQVNNWISTTNPPTRTLSRTIGTGVTTFTETINGSTTTVTTVKATTDIATVTGNFIEGGTDVWYGSATSPCCYSCTIAASTVELFYWPSATPTHAVTSFVSNGFTYQSPSVYIGFSSLSAFDYCGLVGKAFVNATVAFDPDELSTIVFATSLSPPLTFTSFGSDTTSVGTLTQTFFSATGSARLNYADLERNCSTIAGYTFIPGNPSNAVNRSPDPCHPTIVVPDRVRSLDPVWQSCIVDGIGGFYDPPIALTPVSALVSTTEPPVGITTPDADSLPSTTPPIPTQTSATSEGNSAPSSTPTPVSNETNSGSPTPSTPLTSSNASSTPIRNNANNPPPSTPTSGSTAGNDNTASIVSSSAISTPPSSSSNGNGNGPQTSNPPTSLDPSNGSGSGSGNGSGQSNGSSTGNGNSPAPPQTSQGSNDNSGKTSNNGSFSPSSGSNTNQQSGVQNGGTTSGSSPSPSPQTTGSAPSSFQSTPTSGSGGSTGSPGGSTPSPSGSIGGSGSATGSFGAIIGSPQPLNTGSTNLPTVVPSTIPTSNQPAAQSLLSALRNMGGAGLVTFLVLYI